MFVGQRGDRQLTVYSASILGARIEMVLPVRTHGANDVEFVDLKGYPDFFRDCEHAMYVGSRSMSKSVASVEAPAGYLEVHQVGNYKASFAPSWVDLDRADPRVFQLSPRLKAVVTPHYPAGEFGFVIYKPDHGGQMHPLGYRHAVHAGDPLFIPTRHEHGHDGPPDWDHEIYHQGNADAVEATKKRSGFVASGEVFKAANDAGKPVPPEIDLERPMSKIRRKGSFPNEDIEVTAPVAAGAGPAGLLAAGAVVAAGGYELARRARRRGTDSAADKEKEDSGIGRAGGGR
jgi:hypothetical protein